MADAQLLEDYLKKTGKTKTHIAKVMKISRPYMYKLLANPQLCTVGQAEMICKELDIKKKSDRDNIFLP